MRVTLTRGDLVGLLGLTAAAALAVSLGLDPRVAAEIAAVAALLLLVAALLRASPPDAPTSAAQDHDDAHAAARRAVEGALAGPWGVRGRFRRVLRTAVRARLEREGQDLAEVLGTLPPELVDLLDGRWDHDRGLSPTELDRVLTAVEELEP